MVEKKPRQRRWRGAALVELAICLPVFFLITMGTIESCRMIYLRQSLKMAAYETARLALVPGVERGDLETMCDIFLRSRRLEGYRMTLSAEPASLTFQEPLTVTVEIPASECAVVSSWFFREQTFRERVTVLMEY